jgi:hypothetical protein
MFFEYLIWLPYFNDPKTVIVHGRWLNEVGGKRNSIFGLEMGSNEGSKLHIQWLFPHKREKSKLLLL